MAVNETEDFSFPVYLIRSKWSINMIDNFLFKYGEVGFLRIVYDGENKETNRTIAIIPSSTFETLCKEGHGDGSKSTSKKDFKISKYILNKNNFPSKDCTKSFFIPIPPLYQETEVVDTVEDKLNHLSEWEILSKNSWEINVPVESREKGGIKGGCFVSFKNEITLQQLAMVRLLLTDTYWPQKEGITERPIFRCFWSKKREKTITTRNNLHTEDKSPQKIVPINDTKKDSLKTIPINNQISQKHIPKIKKKQEYNTNKNSKKKIFVIKDEVKKIPIMIPINNQPTLIEEKSASIIENT